MSKRKTDKRKTALFIEDIIAVCRKHGVTIHEGEMYGDAWGVCTAYSFDGEGINYVDLGEVKEAMDKAVTA